MLPILLTRLGAVFLVFGGFTFALTYGEGYPQISRPALAAAALGIVFLALAYGLAALGEYIKNRQRASS
jgi:hypothetical protein